MDLTFNHLLKRAMPQPLTKIGSPWLCIPIKNDKQARDTTEVHMSNQGVTGLQGFEKFMNLEVVWLNGNQLTNVSGLDINFRIKHIYLQDNKIRTLKGSLEKMIQLESLVVYNNELRDLDKNLEILLEFPYLKELELFQNPLAEEPYYRMRVINQLPYIVLLDRHIVTGEEQRKVKLWAKDYYSDAKIKKQKGPKKNLHPSQAFSKCEAILYQEVDQIGKRRELHIKEQEETEKQRIKALEKVFDPNKLPTDPLKEELRRKRKEDPLSVITDWEKGRLKKLFKVYDKDKKAKIKQEDLRSLFNDLIADKANLGKIPSIGEQEVLKYLKKIQFVLTIMGDNQEFVQWDTFCFNLNKVSYCRAPVEIINKNISDKYYEFNKKLNTGNRNEGKESLCDAIRLENARDMEETQKYINRKVEESTDKTRGDSFNFAKYKHRQKFSDTAKYII